MSDRQSDYDRDDDRGVDGSTAVDADPDPSTISGDDADPTATTDDDPGASTTAANAPDSSATTDDALDPSAIADDDLIVAERETEEGLLVSVCDGDVLGETFVEGEFSLTVTEEFYAGDGADAVDEPAVVDSLVRATVANIVGTRAVELAVEEGIIDEANVLEIGATRHAQLLRM